MSDSGGRDERPEYAVLLFMSCDVVGSTNYKYYASQQDGEKPGQPRWLTLMQKFYSRFPQEFRQRAVEEAKRNPDIRFLPQLWKAAGDELIFAVPLVHSRHAAIMVRAFMDACKAVRPIFLLDEIEGDAELDLKATGWIASFPVPNSAVELTGDFGEEVPVTRNITPKFGELSKLDFIGPSMDLGFRIGKFSSPHVMTLSADLAHVLAKADMRVTGHRFHFGYDGSQELKGVLAKRPYPHIWVKMPYDAVRLHKDDAENTLMHRERSLRSRRANEAIEISDYCECFFSLAKIEPPYFPDDVDFQTPSAVFEAYLAMEAAPKEVEELDVGNEPPDDGADLSPIDPE